MRGRDFCPLIFCIGRLELFMRNRLLSPQRRAAPLRLLVSFKKYLRTLGFNVVNDVFAENSWYFRNALVRANYNDLTNNITETTVYLERFFRSMLLGEKHDLRNRIMYVDWDKVDVENHFQSANREVQSAKIDEGLPSKCKKLHFG